jgi:hypothetical protein
VPISQRGTSDSHRNSRARFKLTHWISACHNKSGQSVGIFLRVPVDLLGHCPALDGALNPSEVFTSFAATAGRPQKKNETKLRPEDIGYVVRVMLEMDDRGFIPELSIFATNPVD